MDEQPPGGPPWVARALLAIAWLAAMVGAYSWAHKPFDRALLAGAGASLAGFLLWLLLLALGAGLGQRLVGGLLAEEPLPVRLALAAGTGLGFLSLLVLALGTLGLFRPWAAWGLVLVLPLLLRRQWPPLLADLRSISLPRPATAMERWLALFVALSLAFALASALAPDTSWDAHVYHLTVPRLYAAQGNLAHSLDIPESGFPQLAEMQFTLALLLGSDRAAPLLQFGYGLLGLVLVAALAWRAFGRASAWFAVALLLSAPTFLGLMGQAYVEMSLFFYLTAAFYLFMRWRQEGGKRLAQQRTLWLLGISLGLAGGVKYTAAVAPLALGAGLLWAGRRDSWPAQARRLGLVGGIAGILAIPWLLKNALTSGNPVYPFFLDSGRYWDAWRGWFFDRPGTGLLATAPLRLLTAPLEATVLGAEGREAFDATIGPFVLTLLALLPLLWSHLKQAEKEVAGYLGLFFAVHYAFWLWGLARSALVLQTRLLLPAFALPAWLGGLALARLPAWRRPALAVDWVVYALLNLGLALLLFSNATAFLARNPLPVIAGVESRAHYNARLLGPYQEAMAAVNELPPSATVLFLWEPRSYPCRVTCLPDAILDRFLHLTQAEGLDAAGIAASWRAQGISHVLFHQAGYRFILQAGFDPVGPTDQAILAALQAGYLAPVATIGSGEYILYALEGNQP